MVEYTDIEDEDFCFAVDNVEKHQGLKLRYVDLNIC